MARGKAVLFEEQYGAMVRAQYRRFRTPRLLKNALALRIPPILVTDGVLKSWFVKYGTTRRLPVRGRLGRMASAASRRLASREVSAKSTRIAQACLRHRIPAGPIVTAVRALERELHSTYGSGLCSMDAPACEAERPAWAALVRSRMVILQRTLYIVEQEKQVLLDKLVSVNASSETSVRPREWASGMLKLRASSVRPREWASGMLNLRASSETAVRTRARWASGMLA